MARRPRTARVLHPEAGLSAVPELRVAHILLVGILRNGLTVARQLSRAGHVVHIGVNEPDPWLFTSRHVRHAFWHPPLDLQPEQALRAIRGHLDAHPEIEVLFPVSEVSVRLFSRLRRRFSDRVALVLPSEQVVETCIDKAAAFDLCGRIGVPIAPHAIVEDGAGLRRAVEAIGRPCVIKPVDALEGIFGRKAIILAAGDDLAAAVPRWPEPHRELCVQSLVEGPRHTVNFAARSGRLVGAVAMETLRTDRSDGLGYTTSFVSIAPHPEVARSLEALVRALDYTGVGCFQAMVDRATGRTSFLEINPRLGGSSGTAEICGLPLSLLAVELALGRPPAAGADPWRYPVGRRIVWTKGDLCGLKHQWRAGTVGPAAALRWAAALAGEAFRRHLTFDLRDPGPSLWIYLHPLLRRLGLDPWRAIAPAAPAAADEPERAGLDLRASPASRAAA